MHLPIVLLLFLSASHAAQALETIWVRSDHDVVSKGVFGILESGHADLVVFDERNPDDLRMLKKPVNRVRVALHRPSVSADVFEALKTSDQQRRRLSASCDVQKWRGGLDATSEHVLIVLGAQRPAHQLVELQEVCEPGVPHYVVSITDGGHEMLPLLKTPRRFEHHMHRVTWMQGVHPRCSQKNESLVAAYQACQSRS